MRTEQIRETIFRVLRPITPEADFDELAPDENMQEALDIDSFDVLRFFIQLYEELGVEIPEEDYGEIITLKDYEDSLWVEKHIRFVPTVIAYDEKGHEVDRIGAVKMVGIRKGPWQAWLNEMGYP